MNFRRVVIALITPLLFAVIGFAPAASADPRANAVAASRDAAPAASCPIPGRTGSMLCYTHIVDKTFPDGVRHTVLIGSDHLVYDSMNEGPWHQIYNGQATHDYDPRNYNIGVIAVTFSNGTQGVAVFGTVGGYYCTQNTALTVNHWFPWQHCTIDFSTGSDGQLSAAAS